MWLTFSTTRHILFDVVASETGYISGADGLESYVDDDDRLYMEKFAGIDYQNRCGYTIYGNWTGQLKETRQSQIQNSELLCYIKSSLYQIAQTENFKKALYKDYLRTEANVPNFERFGKCRSNPIGIRLSVQC